MLYDDTPNTDEYRTSHLYTIKLDFTTQDKQTFILEFKKDKKNDRRGGEIRVSPEEALDCLDENMLLNIFKDFMCELFIISNFDQYNQGVEIRQLGDIINNDNEYSFKIRAYNDKRLVLSYIQMQNRDNPVGELY